MYFAGESLNILSLLGLMISVGLLVDNSVVVAENIHRLHRDGHSRREAAIRGAGEIALAITMATLTTIVVFLPVSLVEGEAQFFLLRLSLPISVALLASLGGGRRLRAPERLPHPEATAKAPSPTAPALRRRPWASWSGPTTRPSAASTAATRSSWPSSCGRRLDLVMALAVVFGRHRGAWRSRRSRSSTSRRRSGRASRSTCGCRRRTTLEEAEAFFLECEKVVEEQPGGAGARRLVPLPPADLRGGPGLLQQPAHHRALAPRGDREGPGAAAEEAGGQVLHRAGERAGGEGRAGPRGAPLRRRRRAPGGDGGVARGPLRPGPRRPRAEGRRRTPPRTSSAW